MDSDNRKLAQEWFVKSENDLTSVSILLKAKGPPETVCFLCHQSVEKLLKGYLVFKKKRFEKIHDLVLLARQIIELDEKLTVILDSCETLNPYYIEARYPVHSLPLPQEAAESALEKAEFVMTALQSVFK